MLSMMDKSKNINRFMWGILLTAFIFSAAAFINAIRWW